LNKLKDKKRKLENIFAIIYSGIKISIKIYNFEQKVGADGN